MVLKIHQPEAAMSERIIRIGNIDRPRPHHRRRTGIGRGPGRPRVHRATSRRKTHPAVLRRPAGIPLRNGHFDLAGVEHKVELHSATLTALAQLLHVRIVADLGD